MGPRWDGGEDGALPSLVIVAAFPLLQADCLEVRTVAGVYLQTTVGSATAQRTLQVVVRLRSRMLARVVGKDEADALKRSSEGGAGATSRSSPATKVVAKATQGPGKSATGKAATDIAIVTLQAAARSVVGGGGGAMPDQ
ncbi:hypothetical protein T484DRAFT_1850913, partial [Baffinella frigidus]